MTLRGRELGELVRGVVATRVVVLSPVWRASGHERKPAGTLPEFAPAQTLPEFAPAKTLPEFGEAILETARACGCAAVDGLMLVPHQERFLVDGTHPNDEGFLHYALNLGREIGR